MPSIRDIKKKIGGVKNTQQITRAMKMVATAKLRKATERLNAVKFYLEKLETLVADLSEVIGGTSEIHPLFDVRPEVKNVAFIVVAGERGLCGSFNSDIFKFVNNRLKQVPEGQGKHLILAGRKGIEFFRRRNIHILGNHPELNGQAETNTIIISARNAMKLYTTGVVDELYLIYTEYVSALERHVVCKRMLPLEDKAALAPQKVEPALAHLERRPHEMIFDPSPEIILGKLIPKYVEGLFMRGLLESAAAENSARMVAMDTATDRADEMIEDLTLTYNRTRQALITKELSEVIAGVEALSG